MNVDINGRRRRHAQHLVNQAAIRRDEYRASPKSFISSIHAGQHPSVRASAAIVRPQLWIELDDPVDKSRLEPGSGRGYRP
jgi:hypothetical protein